ncbi:Glutamyl-tRNA(Gln) amidotransferase subunit B [Phytophthora fragariae]|uniref:Glutamyl-tRNA(Gln) amidotransferase subunit B, mitochondrial n=1 Tax=Phytophthora fragariae TaxID=53985 RepID=A0A6A3TRG6_9STRA|nr:Glutamyl-tRNA(Gln) amidotransferase subunit B [Phytophthora fragariae]KAE8949926.1 Glutamyl-tRNA(Gln) amidotransferase subunit B [Phytophthora fragariae]KAE9138577.1 Glutamyl-tRNA(Gln) amidotransferase subunit B [Phytophthora fragariae]KAE9140729.1 Glutamyl-tRNA(Gln) amidotransferase subunit B [Phytophthora fragariae]KAE9155291.1 Glutamyl-tRNA(Gln) amidotransferase subunit B [Phytophthora fragariae]
MAQLAANGARPPLLQLLRGPSGKLWEVCIGLEVHAQVLTRSKLMSGAAAATLASARPNRHVSFFDAALPGTLPVINRECVRQAIRTGLAVDATVHARSLFERKHYFYCDLPLGYQLTQQRAPVASGGALHFELSASAVVSEHGGAQSDDEATFDASKYKSRKEKNEALRKWKTKQATKQQQEDVIPRSVRITRIQIEQDSGKSNHDLEESSTVVDLNRAGTALLEIVMEPDLRSPLEAGQVMRQLQHLLRHLDVCDGNMEEGSMRCDLNVSVRPTNLGEEADIEALHNALTSSTASPFGERVEVKNMNSIRNMMRAAEYEARRQIALIEEEGGEVHRETRSFDAVTGETKRMRSKEGPKDYRFFPEPDLPPLVVPEKLIQEISEGLPELPDALKNRLCAQYDLTPYESSVLVNEPGAAQYFETVASQKSRPSKMVVNWVLNDLFGHLKAINGDIAGSPVQATELGGLIDLIQDGTISGKIAKDVLELMFYENEGEKTALQIVEEKGWKQIQDLEEIRALCRAVLEDPKAKKNLDAYWNGKTQLFGFFIGQVMKRCGGRVHPELANSIMQEVLEEHKQ